MTKSAAAEQTERSRGAQGLIDACKRADASADLLKALREIETICTESAGDCRRRMGTRVGNALVTARAAIRLAEAFEAETN